MKRRYKFGIGCLSVISVLIAINAYLWFTREPTPIVIAEAGAGGDRVTINGFPANFYRGAGEGPRPAILLLGGSEGGLREYRNVFARQLAREGYSVLYQAYYSTTDDNKSFNMVPLETFDASLDWLETNPDIRAGPVGIIGHSKGAEAALLVASKDDRIGAVIAAMPSDVVWQGFDFDSIDMSQFSSSFAEGGEPVAYLPYATLGWHEYFTADEPRLEIFKLSRGLADEYPSAFIEVEEVAGPILLICGKDDTLWPGCRMAEALARRSTSNSGPATEVLAYDNAGHWAFGPAENISEGDAKFLGRMGADEKGDIAARKDQWSRILRFLSSTVGDGAPDPSSEINDE
ncbi:acyl-CoA thioester hydrolase/BAAT C-terminal domain-containing protein (plasmid) [Erythrobacteraceae bacterium WH01K]|nr:acyl-CoA thioester hydrolase/BAAT C-terminal domain-containing protein [Erythrobacteraceae bacterium WH01K]